MAAALPPVCGTGMLVYIYAHMYTIHASIALTTYHLGLSSGCLFLLPGGKLFAEGDLILFTAVSWTAKQRLIDGQCAVEFIRWIGRSKDE